MSGKPILSSTYQNLLKAVKAALAGGFLAAQKALEYERLKTYWQIGRIIHRAVKASKGELHLSEVLYGLISNDINEAFGLDVSPDTVGRMVQFHKNYPAFPKGTTLTFSHYLVLQRVADLTFRQKIEKLAIKKHMTIHELKVELSRVNLDHHLLDSPQKKSRLVCAHGEPYVFYLPGCDDPQTIAGQGEYLNQTLIDKGLAELYHHE